MDDVSLPLGDGTVHALARGLKKIATAPQQNINTREIARLVGEFEDALTRRQVAHEDI